MSYVQVEAFNIVGLSIRTTNENGQSAKDIPELWNTFLAEKIGDKVPNKLSTNIYCVYTDYEKDYTKPYTTLLGYRVENLGSIPVGLTGKSFSGGDYKIYKVKGKLADGIVYNEWTKIWNSDLSRAYTADFEVWGEKAQNPDDAEIEIFIAI